MEQALPLPPPRLYTSALRGDFQNSNMNRATSSRMDVVPHLLALITVNFVFAPFHVALDQITQEAVQLDAGMVGAGEAAAAQAAGGHVEIAAVFLNQDVGGQFGRAQQGMRALIDGEIFGNAVLESRIVVLKTRGQLPQRDPVRPVAVNFVGGHVDERRLGAGSVGSFQKMQGSQRIHFEIQKRNGGRAIVRGLRRGVNDQVRAHFVEQRQHALAVPDVERRCR